MRQVYTARDQADAHLVVGYLESHGIEAVVLGEPLSGALGGVPFGQSTAPTVWVADDSDADRACELINERPVPPPTHCPECGYNLTGLPEPRCPECGSRFPRPRPVASGLWRCLSCGEQLAGQFTTCWKCGCERPEAG